MVRQLVADQLAGPRSVPAVRVSARARRCLSSKTLQGLALQGHRAVRVVLAVDLEGTDVDPFGCARRAGRCRTLGHLAGALPRRVVDVISRLPQVGNGMPGRRVQPVGVVPPHQRDLRHRRGVALLVVAQALRRVDGFLAGPVPVSRLLWRSGSSRLGSS